MRAWETVRNQKSQLPNTPMNQETRRAGSLPVYDHSRPPEARERTNDRHENASHCEISTQ